jgi:hypothetical protein
MTIPRRRIKSAVWIPLRASRRLISEGTYGYPDYREEFHGAGSIAVPIEHKEAAKELDWTDIGINHHHTGYVEGGEYVPVDYYKETTKKRGQENPGLPQQ